MMYLGNTTIHSAFQLGYGLEFKAEIEGSLNGALVAILSLANSCMVHTSTEVGLVPEKSTV